MRCSTLALLLLTACSAQSTSVSIPQHVATTPVPRPDDWWVERQATVDAGLQANAPDLVFLGDSITQGWEDVGAALWKQHYAPRNAANLGFSGDRTQHVLWRLRNGHLEGIAPRLCVVMIGTNNSGDDTSERIADGVHAIVLELRERLPETRILVLAIFPRGADADDRQRRVNEGANARIAELDALAGVDYLDIGASFLEPDGALPEAIMPDRLHLSEAGYGLWAEAIEAEVAATLGPLGVGASRD